MKKLLVLAAIIVSFSACSKDDGVNSNAQNITVRYEFTADVLETYDIQTGEVTMLNSEAVRTQNYSRTVTYSKNEVAGDSAVIKVFPPLAWVGTSLQTTGTVKIFVDNVEKASNTAVIGGFDRPYGLVAGVVL